MFCERVSKQAIEELLSRNTTGPGHASPSRSDCELAPDHSPTPVKMAWQHGNVWGAATAAGAAGAAGVKLDDNDGGVHASGSDARADADVPGLAPPSPATTACAKVADGGGATGAAGIAPKDSWQTAQVPKPFKEWNESEVFDWVRSVGETYGDAAAAMRGYGIDGKVLVDMLANDEEELTLGIAEGGLGLKKIQVKTLKVKVGELK